MLYFLRNIAYMRDDPLALFSARVLVALAFVAAGVWISVSSSENKEDADVPLFPRRRGWLALCAPGFLFFAAFSVFAAFAHAHFGGWPPVFHGYGELRPWSTVFENGEFVLLMAGLAFSAIAVLIMLFVLLQRFRSKPCRRSAALFFRFAVLAAVCLLGLLLPTVFLPEGFVHWWYD